MFNVRFVFRNLNKDGFMFAEKSENEEQAQKPKNLALDKKLNMYQSFLILR